VYDNRIIFVNYPDICIVSRMRTVERAIAFVTNQISYFDKLKCTARSFIVPTTDTNYEESFILWTVFIVVC